MWIGIRPEVARVEYAPDSDRLVEILIARLVKSERERISGFELRFERQDKPTVLLSLSQSIHASFFVMDFYFLKRESLLWIRVRSHDCTLNDNM